MYKLALPLLAALVISPTTQDDSTVAAEVTRTIVESAARTRATLKADSREYASEGALEFWSSGGLLQSVGPDDRAETYDSVSLYPKHIEVIALGPNTAVAHYYSEGSMKPTGSPAVAHYLTRCTQVMVKQEGVWKIRSSHWSPVTGGQGTSQSALLQED